MRVLSSLFVVIVLVVSATAARADTISGTIVDVARYVTGTSSAMSMNSDMMMQMMSRMHGGMMGAMGGAPVHAYEHGAPGPTASASPAAGGSEAPMPMMSGGMQGGMQSDTIHAGGMQSGNMHGTMGSASMMQHCGTVGILTKSGTLYLLTTTSNSALRPLCWDIGRVATVTGSVHVRGGMRAIIASAIQLR